MFFKLLNAQELKDHKKKTKKLKKQVFELTQNSIVVKLREDLELSNSRAEHFEREYFNLKKSHETLTDCYRTISEADQQLKADLYDLTKAKDAEIEAMKWSNANESDDLGMEIKNLSELVDDLSAKITDLEQLRDALLEENEALKNELSKPE